MSLRRSMLFSLGGWDDDALAFILAHEASTGLSMGGVQKSAINNLYRRLKGQGTTHGSNLHSMAVTNGARIFPLCPTDNTTASANAYKLDLVSNGANSGTYNNFVSGNFTPQGVIGGATKYFDTGISPNSYPLNDMLSFMYTRNIASTSVYCFGTTDVSSKNRLALTSRTTLGLEFGYYVNNIASTNISSTLANNKGLVAIQRANSSSITLWLNGNIINTTNVSSTGRSSNNIYFHALNNNGTASNAYDKQVAMYGVGLPALTANEHSDLNWIVNLYQTEIITGGRQV